MKFSKLSSFARSSHSCARACVWARTLFSLSPHHIVCIHYAGLRNCFPFWSSGRIPQSKACFGLLSLIALLRFSESIWLCGPPQQADNSFQPHVRCRIRKNACDTKSYDMLLFNTVKCYYAFMDSRRKPGQSPSSMSRSPHHPAADQVTFLHGEARNTQICPPTHHHHSVTVHPSIPDAGATSLTIPML